jgi:cellobiose epimerase
MPRPKLRLTALCLVALCIAVGARMAPLAAQGTPQFPESQLPAPKPITYLAPTSETYLKFAGEADSMLRNEVVAVWFPRCIDNENGGFHSSFARDWTPGRSQGKFSVFQGRMTWIASEFVLRKPELKDQFLPIVRHGVEYLDDVLWDKRYGGFFWGLDDRGQISPFYTDGKHLYGISFGIYGAAAAYQATKDPKALDLAQRAFRWTDQHAHDPKNGGYFEWLTREGKVESADPSMGRVQNVPVALFPLGYKSMNTHIHLLEAFSQLYEVWKDQTLHERIEELLTIVRDKISVEPGAMNLYFTNDWRSFPDHDSYGHDVEATYLMQEAENVLGRGHDPKTERIGKMLVDHALAYGWDPTYGGFFRDGTTTGRPEDKLKEWWVQVEGLNSLLLLHEKYGRQTGVYFKAFQLQWQFIKDYQVDSEFHGMYELVGPDGAPVNPSKGRIWKAAYHDGRGLLNVSERLRKLAEVSTK